MAASWAFLKLIEEWEATHGRKAEWDDYEHILIDTLAQVGIHPRADGLRYKEDFEKIVDIDLNRGRR
jgi:hypothetical protein